YSDSTSQLRPADSECNNRDLSLSLTDGVVRLALMKNNEINQFGNQMQELIGDRCEPQDAYENILSCYFFTNDSWITVTARQDATEQPFRGNTKTWQPNSPNKQNSASSNDNVPVLSNQSKNGLALTSR
ncbi:MULTISPECIES: hypothetical protein, partial [Glutamicibacter]|uniref:hypothetical protein n=1 Tax=Glutamicibacter TaxID=1742989 RepID=UPI003FCF405B